MAYRLEVRHRARPPTPYKWEIYRDDAAVPVRQSDGAFSSEAKATAAGQKAMERLEASERLAEVRPKRPRDSNQLAKSIVDLATGEDTPLKKSNPSEMGQAKKG